VLDVAASRRVPPDVQEALTVSASRLGRFARLCWYDTVGSTNDVAAELADVDAPEGTVVVADSQTSGRGRLGRVWCSPPGAGLYLSLILRPRALLSTHPHASSLLTLASGVAVAEGVEAATGLSAEIKWPNDLVVGKRKLGGILTEAPVRSGEFEYAVVGIGVNLREGAYPPEVARRATSIEAELDRPVDRGRLIVELLAALSGRYASLSAGDFDAILTPWRRRARALPGSSVEWDFGGTVVRGRAVDIDSDGALVVRIGDRVERIVAGEVRWT
jgi:BirA family transcriptional regulator, biotin operon repressor / biotin---[acetyl-CoA-carboxylase] ligase